MLRKMSIVQNDLTLGTHGFLENAITPSFSDKSVPASAFSTSTDIAFVATLLCVRLTVLLVSILQTTSVYARRKIFRRFVGRDL